MSQIKETFSLSRYSYGQKKDIEPDQLHMKFVYPFEYKNNVMSTHPPTHPPTSKSVKALPDNTESSFSVCNPILTQLERRPHKKIEDELQKNE
jgi:hypothetical protein